MALGLKQRIKDGESETKPTRYYSAKQEKAVAKALGGKTTPNSGATDWSKGDLLTDAFLIECKTKTTPSKSITLQKEYFLKNKQEMAFMGKQHEAVVFNFGPDEENHYIIDEYLFKFLIEKLDEYTESI